MARASKLDIHPDKLEILEMLKRGTSHQNIVKVINNKYPEGDNNRISTAAISRYINRDINKSMPIDSVVAYDLRRSTENATKANIEKSVKKKQEFIEVLESQSMNEQLKYNLDAMVGLMAQYISEGREPRDIKALSEATKIYADIVGSQNKTKEDSSGEVTYDDIKAAELAMSGPDIND